MQSNDLERLSKATRLAQTLNEEQQKFYLQRAQQLICYAWMFQNEFYLLVEFVLVYYKELENVRIGIDQR